MGDNSWSVSASDEQGRVDVNQCSPFLLSNLFSGSFLTGDFDADATTDVLLAFDGTATNSGIYQRRSTGGFNKIGNGIANLIEVGNFDGTGDDDIALTFVAGQPASPAGTWIRTDSGYRQIANFTATRRARSRRRATSVSCAPA